MCDGKRDGVWREYASSNNVLVKVEEYRDGHKNGAVLAFSAVGQVNLNETYLNDTLRVHALPTATTAASRPWNTT